jgi:putative photosynthetic complex assembly protein
MSEIVSHNALPRAAVIALSVLLAGVMLSVATVRLSGVDVREPDAPTLVSRSLRFEDTPESNVAVIDAKTGAVIEIVKGEAGFLRGSLRALSRERMKRSIGNGPAFELIGRTDGRLTLEDPATGERLDLESFGPTNAAVYARLLHSPQGR